MPDDDAIRRVESGLARLSDEMRDHRKVIDDRHSDHAIRLRTVEIDVAKAAVDASAARVATSQAVDEMRGAVDTVLRHFNDVSERLDTLVRADAARAKREEIDREVAAATVKRRDDDLAASTRAQAERDRKFDRRQKLAILILAIASALGGAGAWLLTRTGTTHPERSAPHAVTPQVP